MAETLTTGIDDDNLTIMIEALVRMKATLTRDSHSGRRATETRQPDGDRTKSNRPKTRQPEAREAV
jgi:hypothetical protein